MSIETPAALFALSDLAEHTDGSGMAWEAFREVDAHITALQAEVERLQARERADAFTCAALTGLLANPGMVDTMPPETERWIAEQAIRVGTLTAALAAVSAEAEDA